MYCPKCGTQNAEHARTCAACGQALAGPGGSGMPVKVKISGLAIASFVLGILSVLGGLTAIPAIIRAFESRRIQWADISHPWQRPWRPPMMRYVLLYAAASAIIVGGSLVLSLSVGRFALPGIGARSVSAAVHVSLLAGGAVLSGLLTLATLLIGPIILNSNSPRFGSALSDYVRILRNQPGRMAAVVGLAVGAGFVLNIPKQLIQVASGSPFAGCLGRDEFLPINDKQIGKAFFS